MGTRPQAGRHTVAELLDRWLAHIQGQGPAMSTLVRYRSAIDANIKPRVAFMAIAKVGPADVDSFYADLAKTGLSPLAIRKNHAILSAPFNQALKWGGSTANPWTGPRLPGSEDGKFIPRHPASSRAY